MSDEALQKIQQKIAEVHSRTNGAVPDFKPSLASALESVANVQQALQQQKELMARAEQERKQRAREIDELENACLSTTNNYG